MAFLHKKATIPVVGNVVQIIELPSFGNSINGSAILASVNIAPYNGDFLTSGSAELCPLIDLSTTPISASVVLNAYLGSVSFESADFVIEVAPFIPSVSVFDYRMIRDSQIVIGHQASDLSLLHNGVIFDFSFIARVGSPTIVSLNITDGITITDANNEGKKTSQLQDTATANDYFSYNHTLAVIDFYDTLQSNIDEMIVSNGISVEVSDTITFTEFISDGDITQTVSVADMLQETATALKVAQDLLRIAWDAPLSSYDHYEIGAMTPQLYDQIAIYDVVLPQASFIGADDITSHDSAEPNAVINVLDEIISYLDSAILGKGVDFETEDTITSTDTAEEGSKIIASDTITYGDEETHIFDEAWKASDTITATDVYNYSGEKDAGASDSIRFNADSAPYGGEFNFHDSITFNVDTGEGNAAITASDTITIEDKTDSVVSVFDSISISEDTLVLTFQKNVVDSVTATDDLYIENPLYSIYDTISSLDAALRDAVSISYDSLSITDSSKREAVIEASDTVYVYDTQAYSRITTAELFDSITSTDIEIWTHELGRDITDILMFNADTKALTGGETVRELIDIITVTDSALRDAIGEVTDTITLKDTLDLGVNVTDIISFSDSFPSDSVAFEKYIKDSISLSDSSKFGGEFEKSLSDTLSITDSAARNAYMLGDDTLSLSDTLSVLIIISDAITSSDSLYSNFQATIRESITSHDAAIFGGDVTIEKSDSLSIYDSSYRGIVADVFEHVTIDDSFSLIAIISESIQSIDIVSSDWTRKISDSITYRDSATYGGDATKIFTDTIRATDAYANGVYTAVSDSITLQDPTIRSITVDDSIAAVDSLSYIPTKVFSDTIRMSEDKAFGGSFTQICFDTITFHIEEVTQGVKITQSDSIHLSDDMMQLITVSDYISSYDYWMSAIDILKTVSDSITVNPDMAIGGGYATITFTDTLTFRDLVRKEVVAYCEDTLLFSPDVTVRGAYMEGTATLMGSDVVSLQKPYIIDDTIAMSDSSSYYKVQWDKIFTDSFSWKSVTTSLLYIETFEYPFPLITSTSIHSDSFEWFPPYRIIDWVSLYGESFEVASAWLSTLVDTFEYDTPITWEASYSETFEWFSPYKVIILEFSYADAFEWKPVVTDTPIYQDTYEQSEPVWGGLIYRENDPSSAVVWETSQLYIEGFEVIKSVTPVLLFTENFELVSPAVWKFLYRHSFEVSSPALWKPYASYSFEYLSTINWGVLYNDDFEPSKMYRTSVNVAAAKTKRLVTTVFEAYESLVQYSWQTTDPKIECILAQNIVTIPKDSVAITTNVHAYGMRIPYWHTTIASYHGSVEWLGYTNIFTFGEGHDKFHTRISASTYLFKWFNTNIAIGNQLFEKLTTVIYAPNKDKVEKFRSNVSVGRWKFMLWNANIVTATGQGHDVLHNNLVAKKEVTNKLFHNTNIYVGWLITLAIKPTRYVSVTTSYGDVHPIITTDISAPMKDAYAKHKVFISCAYPITKRYRVGITTAYGNIYVLRTSFPVRTGEGVTTFITKITASADREKHYKVTLSTAFRATEKLFINTYIGGYTDAPFVKEVVYTQKSSIKTVSEYFGQYAPMNNRRRINILAGADINHPYIHTELWRSLIIATKSIDTKLKTSIKTDFLWGYQKVSYTNIYALRCSLCIKNSIIASYNTNLSTDIWAAYGTGSTGYNLKQFNIRIWGKRVPQGYFFTNMDVSAKAKNVIGFKSNISIWHGPTYTLKQRIWDTSIQMSKLIIAKPCKTNINVGRNGYKIQTVSNIWAQKGQYMYFRTLINAPMAMKWVWYNTEISATFTSTVKMATNLWAGTADQQRMIYGRTHAMGTTFSALRQESPLVCNSNIKCIGEIIQFITCGIHEISPPIRTEVYASKTLFATIFTTEMPLVAIRSLATMADFVQIGMDTFEDFETAKHIFRQYVLGCNENYNMWVGWRYQGVVVYSYSFDDAKMVTWLNFTKIRNDFQYDAVGTTQHAIGCSVIPYMLNTKIVVGSPDDTNEFIEVVLWIDKNGTEFIDVLLEESLTVAEHMQPNPLAVTDSITGTDTFLR